MIARQSTLVLLDNALGALQGFLALFVITRYMGAQIYGERAFALALAAVAVIAPRLGLPTTHVRRLAGGEDVAASNGAFLRIKLYLTVLFALAAGAAAWLWFDGLHKGITDVTTPLALWVAFWIIVVQSLRDVPVATFQGLRHIREREAVLFTNTVVTALLTVLVGIAYADSHGRWSPLPALGRWASGALGLHAPMGTGTAVDLLMLAFFAGEVAALLLAVALFVRLRIPIGRPTPGLVPAYLLFTVPLMLLAVGEVLTKWLSQLLLGFWWDATTLGQFAGVSKLSELFLLLGSSLGIVMLPAVATLHSRGDEAGAVALVRDVERWSSLLLWPVIAVVAWASGPLIRILLSTQFTASGALLVLLSLQALATSLLMPVQNLAIATGRPAFAARIVLVSVVAGVALNAVLVPTRLGPLPMLGLGALGAALAALASTLLALVLYATPHSGWRGHNVLRRPLLLHALAATVTWALLTASRLPPPTRFYQLPLYGLAAAVPYALTLVLLRELRPSDLRHLRDLVAPQTAKKP